MQNQFAPVTSAMPQLSAIRARGFTLIELLIVLAITATLLLAAVLSISGIAKSTELSSVSDNFVSMLNLARSEAIKRNSRVVLCKSADRVLCTTSGGWEQGVIVFHDQNNNAALDPGEGVILRAEGLPSRMKLVGNLNVARYVSFAPTGAAKLMGGSFQAGTLTLCHESMSAGEGRQIILNAVGRPRVQKVALNACA